MFNPDTTKLVVTLIDNLTYDIYIKDVKLRNKHRKINILEALNAFSRTSEEFYLDTNNMTTFLEKILNDEFNGLKWLDLAYNHLRNVKDFQILTEIISLIPTLTYLNLTKNSLGVEGTRILSTIFPTTNLKALEMDCNSCGDGAKFILDSYNQLEYLSLDFNNVGSVISENLTKNYNLRHLKFEDNYLQDDSVAFILDKFPNLTHLHLRANDLYGISFDTSHYHLKYLDLKDNNINNDGLKSIANLLKEPQVLEHLDLSYIYTIADLQYLSYNLQSNLYLKTLLLNYCALRRDRLVPLINSLIDNKTLKRLELNSNPIGEGYSENDTFSSSFLDLIRFNNTLKRICIAGCHIDIDEKEEIFKIFHHNALICTFHMENYTQPHKIVYDVIERNKLNLVKRKSSLFNLLYPLIA